MKVMTKRRIEQYKPRFGETPFLNKPDLYLVPKSRNDGSIADILLEKSNDQSEVVGAVYFCNQPLSGYDKIPIRVIKESFYPIEPQLECPKDIKVKRWKLRRLEARVVSSRLESKNKDLSEIWNLIKQ